MTVATFETQHPVGVLDRLPCRLVDPELFFAESPDDVEYAKALCRNCPRQADCLSGALERAEPWGVWGGELFLRAGDLASAGGTRGAKPFTASAIARMCGGVVPQQPPTMFSQPFSA